MSLTERIIKNLKTLPESKQVEVLDFVEYLRSKEENIEWNDLSLSSAMRGMEDEKTPYSINDLKETF
jgi:hypothetical protein